MPPQLRRGAEQPALPPDKTQRNTRLRAEMAGIGINLLCLHGRAEVGSCVRMASNLPVVQEG